MKAPLVHILVISWLFDYSQSNRHEMISHWVLISIFLIARKCFIPEEHLNTYQVAVGDNSIPLSLFVTLVPDWVLDQTLINGTETGQIVLLLSY